MTRPRQQCPWATGEHAASLSTALAIVRLRPVEGEVVCCVCGKPTLDGRSLGDRVGHGLCLFETRDAGAVR